MNENVKYAAGAVLVVGLSVGAVLWRSRSHQVPPLEEEPVAAAPVAPAEPPAPPVPEEPAIKHPVAEPEQKAALPPLNESNQPLQLALTDLIGKESVERFVYSKDLARQVVATIDNLTTEKVAERLRPVRPAPGTFAVNGPEEAPVLDPANYARYQPMVQVLSSLDTQRLVEGYVRYYPLFQEAYENLGHPPEYFNDRVIEVIDHLLATPELKEPIALAQPNVLYVFADPAIESRSAGQKLLIRMGSDNAAKVKAKLRELRTALAAQKPAG